MCEDTGIRNDESHSKPHSCHIQQGKAEEPREGNSVQSVTVARSRAILHTRHIIIENKNKNTLEVCAEGDRRPPSLKPEPLVRNIHRAKQRRGIILSLTSGQHMLTRWWGVQTKGSDESSQPRIFHSSGNTEALWRQNDNLWSSGWGLCCHSSRDRALRGLVSQRAAPPWLRNALDGRAPEKDPELLRQDYQEALCKLSEDQCHCGTY